MREVDLFLAHYGIKGMRWGVRKARKVSGVGTSLSPPPGVTMRRDGSIEIKKGATLQRLVRSNGQSLPMKDLTYASLNDYDNSRYIKIIGGKGFFGGGRDQILTIKATKSIKAPSKIDAVKMNSDLILNDKKYRDSVSMIGVNIDKKVVEKIRQNPTGKEAVLWYETANTALTFSKDFDPKAPYVQSKFKEKIQSSGFNAIRDENDANSGIAKAPIIIF